MKQPNIKVVCQNKRARHNYHILEVIEAGMVLLGTEVKSLRQGRANLKDSYARIKDGDLFLMQAYISPYSHAYYDNHEPERARKLLVHKREIKRLRGKTEEKGLTLVPLRIYFKDGKAKVELALARGKRTYDKRQTLKRKTEERDMERAIKERR
jgi:SsrA-binding protein